MTNPAAPSAAGFELRPYGDRAVLLELTDGLAPLDAANRISRLAIALRHNTPDGVHDIVPAARTVAVLFDPARTGAISVGEWLLGVVGTAPALVDDDATPNEIVEIEVRYDGIDLHDVARSIGRTVDDVITLHTAPVYRVAFCGFAPGFSYLVGTDPVLQLPRRAEPRARVPAGSVATAAGFSAVYPTDSPGGWLLLGTTAAVLWDEQRDFPALLPPGAAVRFSAL